jgi:hypothetical protein
MTPLQPATAAGIGEVVVRAFAGSALVLVHADSEETSRLQAGCRFSPHSWLATSVPTFVPLAWIYRRILAFQRVAVAIRQPARHVLHRGPPAAVRMA